jgi:bifunctional non-homologous end joining protein LigD
MKMKKITVMSFPAHKQKKSPGKTPVTGLSKKSTSKKNAGTLNKEDKRSPMLVNPAAKPVGKASSWKASKENITFPGYIQPMLATLVDKPFEEPGWIYELKWDGYRAISYLNKGNVEIRSRNNKSFNEKFYPVHTALQNWKINAVVDGEIIVVNDKGFSDFSNLQTWRSEADGQLVYYLFDILWLEGRDLMDLPLKQRREILQTVMPKHEMIIQRSENFDTTGSALFSLVNKMGLEGIIVKKELSVYKPGARSKEWLKIKTEKRQEAIIGGYTRNENTSKLFSALLLGLYQDGQFHFIGPVGTGFNNKMQKEILEKLKPLEIPECSFAEVPDYNKPSRFRPNPPKAEVTWVKPELVVEISYRELTRGGAIRHPSFKGLREDKNAKEVVKETPADTNVIIKEDKNMVEQKLTATGGTGIRKTLLNPRDETQVRNIEGHDLKFTNLSKIYWPDEKVTKRDMLNYYYQVTPFILPYLKDRPQTLNRFPHGINGESFYQKDVSGKVPGWMKTFPYHSERDGRDKNFLVCNNEASLLYIASLGCIEMNPWSSRIQKPEQPDWCIIDLDPDKNSFEQVIRAAQVTREVLDSFHISSCCKTSGSTGLHIYIPLAAKYTYEQSKEFARMIVKLVHAEIPSFTSIERLTQKRKGCIYLDFLQNRPQATVAAPYSLRPKPGATVSAPLHWEEVRKGLTMKDFTIFNMVDRLKDTGDLFKPILHEGIDLEKAVKKIEGYLK